MEKQGTIRVYRQAHVFVLERVLTQTMSSNTASTIQRSFVSPPSIQCQLMGDISNDSKHTSRVASTDHTYTQHFILVCVTLNLGKFNQ